ncbi:MAG: BtpA/SgcQ family protein [Gordonia sp. (in: high G+C Gram-positive bacteria)]
MRIYPVVHINSTERAVAESLAALELGADGIYLIDHHNHDPGTTWQVFSEVDRRRPAAHIGVNLLGFSTVEVIRQILDAHVSGALSRIPDSVWLDDIRHHGATDPDAALVFARQAAPSLRIVGGIAFKYTPTYTDDADQARAEVAALENAVDVVTTSGSGTGSAPPVSKMRAIRAATVKPIAVASGISIDNITDYAGLVDEILVASSVETTPHSGIFDRATLQDFLTAGRSQG